MKRMESFENGTHNETWVCQGYTDAINKFLNEVSSYRLFYGYASFNLLSANCR